MGGKLFATLAYLFMLAPLFAATSVALDLTLISAVIGILAFVVSAIWSVFQMKQKLEAQDDSLKTLVLENRELINDLRRDTYYAVCALDENTQEIQQFLARPTGIDRQFNIRQRSGLPPEGFLKNNKIP